AAVAPEDDDDQGWTRPAGKRGELEKEKRTLLKAIKEAEFDHEMGKLSRVDADSLVRTYRTRAIEVIKEIERADAGRAQSVREEIEREIQARLKLADKNKKSKQQKKGEAATKKPKSDETPVAATESGSSTGEKGAST